MSIQTATNEKVVIEERKALPEAIWRKNRQLF